MRRVILMGMRLLSGSLYFYWYYLVLLGIGYPSSDWN